MVKKGKIPLACLSPIVLSGQRLGKGLRKIRLKRSEKRRNKRKRRRKKHEISCLSIGNK
jgi:hypothetical protein